MTDKRPLAQKSFRKIPQTSKRQTLRKNVGKTIHKEQKVAEEWTTEGFLHEVETIHETMEDRAFAFILGAGASVSSEIPAGGQLAGQWLNELYKRKCQDKNVDIEQWAKTYISSNFELKNVAAYYPQIFELRFQGDWESGYASLEHAMKNKQPSWGYSLLAQILTSPRHNAVVTTNFDNLVANALAIHAQKQPLVVGHEGLSSFVRPNRNRPLVAKIHRDLYLHPKNDKRGVDTLEKGWNEALQRLFSHYTPIVIGYGGNDGSLMNFLRNEKLKIPGRLFWCYRGDEKPTNPIILETVAQHNGVFVSIEGFDEIMLQLCSILIKDFNYYKLVESIAKLGEQRAIEHQNSANTTLVNFANKLKNSESIRSKQTWASLSKILHNDAFALSWVLQAFTEEDNDKADVLYQKALSIEPNNTENIRQYAIFLSKKKKDFEKAEEMFAKAQGLDSKNASITFSYASFIANQKGEIEKADEMYQKALELSPNDAGIAMVYTGFLEFQKIDIEKSDQIYQKAISLNPSNPQYTGAYARFLADRKNDINFAEKMYQKAIELDPKNVINTHNYAIFLQNHKKDNEKSKLMYLKAIDLDPKNPLTITTYAVFLDQQKHDHQIVEETYQRAIELDPEHAIARNNYSNFNANFCSRLLQQETGENFDQINERIQKIIKLSSNVTTQALAEGLIYGSLCNELKAESNKTSLAMLKFVIQKGYKREGWDFSEMFTVVLPRIAEEKRALYLALGAAILDEAKVADLDAFEEWVDLPAVSPFESV